MSLHDQNLARLLYNEKLREAEQIRRSKEARRANGGPSGTKLFFSRMVKLLSRSNLTAHNQSLKPESLEQPSLAEVKVS